MSGAIHHSLSPTGRRGHKQSSLKGERTRGVNGGRREGEAGSGCHARHGRHVRVTTILLGLHRPIPCSNVQYHASPLNRPQLDASSPNSARPRADNLMKPILASTSSIDLFISSDSWSRTADQPLVHLSSVGHILQGGARKRRPWQEQDQCDQRLHNYLHCQSTSAADREDSRRRVMTSQTPLGRLREPLRWKGL